MVERDDLIFQYSHLNGLPREKEAPRSLQKVTSLVKPIMRARNWKVITLVEFYPDHQNLLGINENRGQRICLRLRHPGDKNQFLTLEQVVDTMLHELSHNVHGPHDAKFHALWDYLRAEYEGLIAKGYARECSLSEGHQLCGHRVPLHEARRIARVAAEKRCNLSAGSGQRLGGAPVRVGTDIREVIALAAERRNKVTHGCGSENENGQGIKQLADQAMNNGLCTQVEEDEVNGRAIDQALWGLVQEDEKAAAKHKGVKNRKPSSANPSGSSHNTNYKPEPSLRQPTKPMSRLVREGPTKPAIKKPSKERESKTFIPLKLLPPTLAPLPSGWTCSTCTLHNHIDHPACDACMSERPQAVAQNIDEQAKKNATAFQRASNIWQCHTCSTIMEDKWWSCSNCSAVKKTS
ncbi:zinc ion binding protein-like protein [Calycina marina]|uniref:Zinc ion binding protein-like protein n=1 Tax=Calycina marina TaxID=1763456 RepID=A0A9P7Z4D1_9HELO|nr:zinc ion binding protein-like protein [Calycina marina]